MQDHLKASCRLYFQEPIKGINPVSMVDCEIIEMLVKIAQEYGHLTFQATLEQWKAIDDVDILSALKEVLSRAKQQSSDEEDDNPYSSNKKRKPLPEYILQIGSFSFKARFILGWECGEDYNIVKGQWLPIIKLNPQESGEVKGVFYVNTIIYFDSFDERDAAVEKMKKDLSQQLNYKFI